MRMRNRVERAGDIFEPAWLKFNHLREIPFRGQGNLSDIAMRYAAIQLKDNSFLKTVQSAVFTINSAQPRYFR